VVCWGGGRHQQKGERRRKRGERNETEFHVESWRPEAKLTIQRGITSQTRSVPRGSKTSAWRRNQKRTRRRFETEGTSKEATTSNPLQRGDRKTLPSGRARKGNSGGVNTGNRSPFPLGDLFSRGPSRWSGRTGGFLKGRTRKKLEPKYGRSMPN